MYRVVCCEHLTFQVGVGFYFVQLQLVVFTHVGHGSYHIVGQTQEAGSQVLLMIVPSRCEKPLYILGSSSQQTCMQKQFEDRRNNACLNKHVKRQLELFDICYAKLVGNMTSLNDITNDSIIQHKHTNTMYSWYIQLKIIANNYYYFTCIHCFHGITSDVCSTLRIQCFTHQAFVRQCQWQEVWQWVWWLTVTCYLQIQHQQHMYIIMISADEM